MFDEVCEFVGLLENFCPSAPTPDSEETPKKLKYSELVEEDKCRILSECLNTKRPVIPSSDFPLSDRSKEVTKTFRLCSSLGTDALGAYVVSMAARPSDVLLVELLQREFVQSVDQQTLRVVPLLETIEALQVRDPIIQFSDRFL